VPVRRVRLRTARWRRRLVEQWVPEPLRTARIDPGRRGSRLLVAVAATAAVAAAVGVWWQRPTELPLPAATVAVAAPLDPAVPPAAPPGGSGRADAPPGSPVPPSAPPAADRPILVSVTGLVRSPGVVTLSPGARVADAIAAAGGPADGADLTGLNLAGRLTDEASVVVGAAPAAGAAPGPVSGAVLGGSTPGPSAAGGGAGPGGNAALDLNTADRAALEALPGVGPVMAGNILAFREANGPFTAIEQLQEIPGIGPARYAQLAPLVRT
jgi:competence protein ComEA